MIVANVVEVPFVLLVFNAVVVFVVVVFKTFRILPLVLRRQNQSATSWTGPR